MGLLAGSVLYMGSSKDVSSSVDNDIDFSGPAYYPDGSPGEWNLMLPPALEGGKRQTKRKTRRHRK